MQRGKHQAPPAPIDGEGASLPDPSHVETMAPVVEGLEKDHSSDEVPETGTAPSETDEGVREHLLPSSSAADSGACTHLDMVSPAAVNRLLRQHRLLAFPCKVSTAHPRPPPTS